MALYVQCKDIEGEATDSNHQKWIICDSASLPVFRSIPSGAVDQQRTKGETSLGDITLVRQLDKSSPKLMEACALGKFNKEVKIEQMEIKMNIQRKIDGKYLGNICGIYKEYMENIRKYS